jgi:photoactive yellow protein
MSFVAEETFRSLGSLTRDEADTLPFGVVKLDNSGTIIMCNKYQAELGKVTIQEVEGKNFFSQVAPCTNNKLFKGKFEQGVSAGSLDAKFNYTFTYKLRPTNVAVHLFQDPTSHTNWAFFQKR